MKKTTWIILLSTLIFGGLLTVGFLIPAELVAKTELTDTPVEQAILLPSLAPHKTRTPFITFTVTATPLQPIPPTRIPTRTPTQIPTKPPEPDPTLPPKARIEGIYGYGQLLPLSCESRSAADWARHFGIEIREMEFFNRIPKSEDPNEGFVGNVNGGWGNIPPGPYGVHAEPVSEVLRAYGAKAVALKGTSFEALKYELSSGRPVIVWVTGHVAPGRSVPYEINGRIITVAPYEHTVIAIGYDDARNEITVLDGREVYARSYEAFQESWANLENMSIIWDE